MGHSAWGLVLACGKDQQIGSDADTAFLSIGTKPVLMYTLEALEGCEEIEGVVVVTSKARMESVVSMVQMFGITKVKKVAAGTTHRRGCVQSGLDALDEEVTVVTVHEASRPCVTAELVGETIKAAKRYGSGVAASRVTGPVHQTDKGLTVKSVLDSSKLWNVQTPQSFKRELLEKGLAKAAKAKQAIEDESSVLMDTKKPIHLVEASRMNMKIHEADDLVLISAMLENPAPANA